MNNKPHKYSVSLVIENEKGEVLAIQRPADDEDGLTSWGLPAASKLSPDEPWESVAHRVAKEKLGVEVELGEMIGEKDDEREAYYLMLRDYRARIIKGEPNVNQKSAHGGSIYRDWKWVSDYSLFVPTASHGSLCTQIFLEHAGVRWT